MDDYISRTSVTVGLDYIINEFNKLITDDSPNDADDFTLSTEGD